MSRSVLLAGVLFLSGCAPLVQLAQPKEKARLYREGLTVVLDNAAKEALTGNPKVTGDGIALTVDGARLITTDPRCRATEAGFECLIPAIPAGEKANVVFSAGVINDYVASGYRASSGAKPVVLWGE